MRSIRDEITLADGGTIHYKQRLRRYLFTASTFIGVRRQKALEQLSIAQCRAQIIAEQNALVMQSIDLDNIETAHGGMRRILVERLADFPRP
jgi:hypothetical protein